MLRGKKSNVIIIAIILIIVIIAICKITSTSNKPKTSVNDFKNIKELVTYYDCKYIETKGSSEEDYKKDIILEFSILPINEDGGLNKAKYEEIISSISTKMKPKNYRIIDEKNNILIKVNFTEDGKVAYIINDDPNYFEHLSSKFWVENAKDKNTTNFTINSRILSSLVNNKWRTTNLNLGTRDSKIDKYDIYFDEGYKIRKINGRVYNIVFTNKYGDAVVNNIHTNNSFEQIKEVLGQATYEVQNENAYVIGYKNDELYVFFGNEQISIYPNESGRDSEKFASLVSNLIETNNQSEFLSKLTDEWPDYYNYTKSDKGAYIEYPLKGVKIDFTVGQKAKIIIYENYKGNITKDLKIEDIKESKTIPATYINLKLDDNLVSINEVKRQRDNIRNRYSYADEATIKTSKYRVYLDVYNNKCSFYSVDMNNIDSIIELKGLDNIYMLNDVKFIYSIYQNGIYAYDAAQMQTIQLISGTEEYKIKEVKDNIIYYDNKSIKVEK